MKPVKHPIIQEAADLVGSQQELAKALGITQGAVSWLIRRANSVPAEHAINIERITGGKIKASAIRPDLWPPQPSEAA